ncbi:hypothetical protein ERO13_D09G042400v2 [Gossypium hirsutum]|uniref:Uncharacterized protein isoform X8 n=1 Tax=Gossypium hirsutum TaxID=3635 RepID=A0ABM3ASA2_GOSHI|nr:uncharacterized protein LOC107892077 isoform X8 [Gossypium hirsutum]KAG4128811.1 hypothetical protein ERO13_D09G042400v2 [Gossypium hirsutum]
MASTTVTLSPSSPQLRLALRCRNSVEPRALLVGAWTTNLDSHRRLRLLSLTRSRSKRLERRHNGVFRIVADSTAGAGADAFSGWSDSEHVEDSVDSRRNGWFGGIIRAGSVGLVLVAGLSFAAMSIGNQSTARTKQQLEPLTALQEVLLASDNETDKSEENESKKALQVHPGKVLIPAVVDQVQGQALAALQVLKVIEADAQPSDLCTRREYARWLVSGSGVLSRNSVSKVYPAMYIENVTELAFDDITPEDPDFSSIQGLAEAGLISSKLSNKDLLNDDLGPFYFSPESPLSRQDLVSWKMALEKRQLPEGDKKILYQISGFIDIDKINPDAWPAVVADMSAGEQGIIALAFGCTRLFQPNKPVTKAQVAVALATGEAFDLVNEELARIEAESMAEKAVSAHNALVAEVEKDVNASFEKELLIEKEKIDAVEKMAEEALHELERLKAEREAENMALMKDRAAIDSEMEALSRLRCEVEEQLESLMNNKVEISYEKEAINKLRKETEDESQEVVRLQHELEVERKALSMARAWAEDEAKRAREQAKALEEARERWERQGIKVVVDKDLQEETIAEVTWVNVGKKVEDEVEGTVTRSEALVKKLKALASEVKWKTREFISKIIQKIQYFISMLKEWASIASAKAGVLKDRAASSTRGSVQELQQSTAGFSSALKEGAKRVAGDCRKGVEKLTQRFRT